MDTAMEQQIVHERCPPPKTTADLGMEFNLILRLLLKTIYVRALETPSQLTQALKLTPSVVSEILEEAKDQKLVEVLGAAGLRLSAEFRFGLTGEGRRWAIDALEQSLYIGPAPVSLVDYHAQIARQRLNDEQVSRESLVAGLSEMVLSDAMIRQIGPAVNSGRSMLLYGSPGNGKTTIAEAIGHVFGDVIHIPYCLEVDGQIIKIFDPATHEAMEDLSQDLVGGEGQVDLRTEGIDRRWVACKRPLVLVGGELNLAMLDLSFNPYARFYEAPLHMKAIGGVFVIDDLGRQLVRPDDLLNRWIGPMERRTDYLTLNTGKTFEIPFDELLVFSTNLLPEDIMDPAFLRRIAYKIGVPAPTPEQFQETLEMECTAVGLHVDEALGRHIMREVTERFEQPLAFYQPVFLLRHIANACRYENREPDMETELITEACMNLAPRSADLGMKRYEFNWKNKGGDEPAEWVPPEGA